MAPTKSLGMLKLALTVLHDIFDVHGAEVFNAKSRKDTLKCVESRFHLEGEGFLTKSLPKLGKAFDRALTGDTKMIAKESRFAPRFDGVLPILLGELFQLVFTNQGALLNEPSVHAVRSIRQFLFLFYKYELPYSADDEQKVVDSFVRTEDDLVDTTCRLDLISHLLNVSNNDADSSNAFVLRVARQARQTLRALFAEETFDIIRPKHGPGAVSTGERLWNKYHFSNIPNVILEKYPIEHFFASYGHICDQVREIITLPGEPRPAKVCLVPKDSRGPRLISSEPLENQFIQQGIRDRLCRLLETHPLTRDHVFFTNQEPNQFGALLGSAPLRIEMGNGFWWVRQPDHGEYATLDLKEASDRVSLRLVRLLFPPRIAEVLECCRSQSTKLPDGRLLPLLKFAPMGSALCFPVMALLIWVIIDSVIASEYLREKVLVYGDDVITPRAVALDVIAALESFGLLVNRPKSCLNGFFRESCGTDAFRGHDVTPVKLKTVFSVIESASTYSAWLAYCNELWDRGYFKTYDLVVSHLRGIYPLLVDETWAQSVGVTCLCLRYYDGPTPRRRVNVDEQVLEYLVPVIRSPSIQYSSNGWETLLRFFIEAPDNSVQPGYCNTEEAIRRLTIPSFNARSYTRRDTTKLAYRWRRAGRDECNDFDRSFLA